MVMWRNFKPPQVLEAIWDANIHHMMYKYFVQQSQFSAENWNNEMHGSIITHIGRSILFIVHEKADGKILFYKIFF